MESDTLSLPAESNSKDVACEQIDSEIEQHCAAITSWKTRRNKLSPIATIPPEILCNIFLSVKGSAHNVVDMRRTQSLSCINISHVCAHWRNVAINLPILWDNPPLSKLRWTEEMLTRSKAATLSIDHEVRISYPQKQTLAEIAGLKISLQHIARIGILAIRNITVGVGHELSIALAAPAPQLGVLHIENANVSSFPTKMLMAAGTKLHTLHIMLSRIEGAPYFPHSLTDLTLYAITYTAEATLQGFVEALGKLTHLHNLDIKHALPAGSLDIFEQPAVRFASLQSLNIESSLQVIPTLLGAISFPPSAKVRVACLGDTSHEICRSVMAALKQTYMARPTTYFRSLQVTRKLYTADTRLQFNFSWDALEDEGPENLALVFCMDAWTGDGISDAVVDLFESGFPLEGITHVHLGADMQSEVLTKTFGVLPALAFVKAQGDILTRILIRALNPQPEGQFYFKNVTSLKIVWTTFSRLNPDTDPRNGVSTQDLEECLKQRNQCNTDITTLTMEKCSGIMHTDVDRLKRITPNVHCDQIQMEKVDSDSDDYENYYDDEHYDDDDEHYDDDNEHYDDDNEHYDDDNEHYDDDNGHYDDNYDDYDE